MKYLTILIAVCCLWACQNKQKSKDIPDQSIEKLKMDFDAASTLVELPLQCATKEYPNKLGQVIGDSTDLKQPKTLHPAFYGCFDWHSAVHGHWSMVELLKLHSNLKQADSIKNILKTHLTPNKVEQELAYFQEDINGGYERMYGWAWLFKLSQSLHEWNDSLGQELFQNLKPLADELENKFEEFIPKLIYPIRVGEHTNTAFALNLMYEYAVSLDKIKFQNQIKHAALRFYSNDKNCPLSWEPSGYDFLSPCLEEAVLMQKVLEHNKFKRWIKGFLPSLNSKSFQLTPATVSDRSDGKLVHLDGLNFSRAWNLFKLSDLEGYRHLKNPALEHYQAAYPNLIGDSYEGGHWLGSFAAYAYLAQ